MKAQVNYIDAPLKNMDLEGLHLIEASAGTGKTWTLSSLMTRILTEKYMPRQVIATTFTRAAAAELKSRIRLRLQEMQQLVNKWVDLDPVDYQTTFEQLSDPLAQILFKHFQDAENERQNFRYLDNRLKLVIDSLDELFVGTIDSFTQKLLREFSFDSGEILPRQITEKEKQYPYQIVHDVLRGWLNQQSQEVVDLLLLSNSLKDTDSYVAVVQKTLNFSQAKLQEVDYPVFTLERIAHIAEKLKSFEQTTDLLKDYKEEGVFYAYFKDSTKTTVFEIIDKIFPVWQKQFQSAGMYFLFDDTSSKSKWQLSKKLQKLGSGLFSTSEKSLKTYFADEIELDAKAQGMKKTEWFKQNKENYTAQYLEDLCEPLMQHGLMPLVVEFFEAFETLKNDLQAIDHYLHYYLSIEVKKRLPQTLLNAGETTFNQQTRTLSEALQGAKGEQLAQHILQRYPIILVDEFQDTNQEQDNILQTIWRDKRYIKQSCFIAVGDPKQAIYGFRGGDILTYVNAFNDIAAKQGKFYRLMHNFRSVAHLVDVVDHLFMREPNFGEDIEYYQAKSGNAALQPLKVNGDDDLAPLKIIHIPTNYNEAYIVARKIRGLLLQSQQHKLHYLANNEKLAIYPEDIAVLAASQRELDLVQKQLEKCNIQVNRAALSSVFSTQIAQDIGAILQAIVQPDHEPKLKRALLAPAIGLTLEDFQRFEQQAEELSQYMHHFRYARQIWLSKGFLLAWQWLAEHYQIWKNLAQHQADQAERTIVNARHLIELLSQHSYQYQGIQHLLHWYQLQLSSPQQRDWELERKLSSASGVQLMTIHKSKGLEFKIVFLMNANKSVDLNKSDLGFFEQTTQDRPERVITISPKLLDRDEKAKLKHQEKIMGENHRLWYVALTRASYAIYLIFNEKTKKQGEIGGAEFWLKPKHEGECFTHTGFIEESIELIQQDYRPEALETLQLQAIAYPKQFFYPKTRTSFSYLSAHKSKKRTIDALAEYTANEEGAIDEIEQALPQFTSHVNVQPLTWIQQNFPKGAQAGNCLHDLLEEIDFQDANLWERDIQRKLTFDGMWPVLIINYQNTYGAEFSIEHIKKDIIQQMVIWLEQLMTTPIHPFGQGWLTLNMLSREQRVAEFDFYLSLADQRFMTQSIHQLYQSYGFDMPEFEQANTARYLNGAIDLMYFDGQKFHIADYKSNYLGDDLTDYQPENIAQNMSDSSYWLQAGLYLVALHRHLKVSLLGYQPELHLGGASYLYLRGMQGLQGYGVQHWDAPLQLILQLDELLGYHQMSQFV